MKIISIANQKGGVGKTTTSINLGYCLSALGKHVLIIDIDPQSNATKGLGVTKFNQSIYSVMLEETPISKVIINTGIENFDIVPCTIKLASAEQELTGVQVGRETILRDSIRECKLKYDYVLIDCSPSLGILTINALAACNSVLIPMQASIFSFEGTDDLLKTIHLVKKKIDPKLDIFGVLLTQLDSRTKIAKEFQEALKKLFGNKAFKTQIHNNVKISESQSSRTPVNIYDPKSKGALDYMELAKEVVSYEKNK